MTITVDIRPSSSAIARFPEYARSWSLQGEWNPNAAEKEASWELLVELVTRISVVPLGQQEGLLREALSSLHQLFGMCRATLKRHGPALAQERPGELSIAVITAQLLNNVLRPVLATWHPRLQEHEVETGTTSAPTPASEREWADHDELRDLLRAMQDLVVEYGRAFAEACQALEFFRFLLESVRAQRT